jgi:iron complex outermembrane receptor protein
VKGPRARDEITGYKVKTQRPLSGVLSRVEAGAAFTQRSKYEYESGPGGMEGYFLALKNGATSAPMPASVGTTDLSFIGMGKQYSYDPLALFNSGFYDQKPNTNPSYVSNNWDVDEKISLAYVKFDLKHKLGNVPVTGNIGTQIVHSDQTASGLAANGTTVTKVKGTHTYNDFVPSLNLNFKVADAQTVRFSASRQLARQRMNDMRAGSTYSYDQKLASSTDPLKGAFSGSGGNPELEPWRSNSLDLSFENYFADHMGYWAVAAFYKDLVSYTYTQPKIVDFTGYPTGLPTGTAGSVPATFKGVSSVPQNGQGGAIRGLEFAVSLPGEKFSRALKGWGVLGSASFFKSAIQPDLSNPSVSLPGLSDRVMTGTIYYEAKNGFGGRVSARYRSDYRGDISTFGPRGENFRNLQAETNIDAQISYAFNKGALKGLTLIAQGYNLNDEPLQASQGTDTRLVQDYQRYGASYSIGASYKF